MTDSQVPAPEVAALGAKLRAMEIEMRALQASQAGSRGAIGGRTPLGRLARAGAVAGLLLLALGTNVFASIPDGGAVIHSCYAKSSGQLRVIDTAAHGKCGKSEATLTWNQAGPQGPAGMSGAAGPVGLKWLGQWTTTTAYHVNDAVFDKGSSWIALAANTGSEPNAANTSWSILAQQGSQGPAGPVPTPDIVYASNSEVVKAFVALDIRATCPAGKQPIAGGYRSAIDVNRANTLYIISSSPVTDVQGSSWSVVVANFGDANNPASADTVTVYAVCATLGAGVVPPPAATAAPTATATATTP